MSVTLAKETPGTKALADVLSAAGAGLHTVHVAQFHQWDGAEAGVQVLYGGADLVIGGPAVLAGMERVAGIIHASMRLGVGRLTVFTDRPTGPRTVARFHIEGGEVITEAEHDRRRYGSYPQALASARAEHERRDAIDLNNFGCFKRAALAAA
jgi:hypothetical protein